MSEFKGTKGKWYALDYAGKFIIQTGEYYSDTDDILQCDDYPEEEVKANAQLISKAPEMLEMLQGISELNEGTSDLLESVRKLIKEATTIDSGESNSITSSTFNL